MGDGPLCARDGVVILPVAIVVDFPMVDDGVDGTVSFSSDGVEIGDEGAVFFFGGILGADSTAVCALGLLVMEGTELTGARKVLPSSSSSYI